MERRDHEMKYAGTKTERNLREAFAGESQARNQYTFFAGVAREQGYEQIAALFLKTAENEREHAELWLKALEGISDTEWIQKQTLAMLSEMAELLNEVNFKWWKNPKPVDDHAVKEELVDILHFFVSMCLRAGMTPQEMYDIYMEKNRENFNRQLGLSQKEGYKAPEA